MFFSIFTQQVLSNTITGYYYNESLTVDEACVVENAVFSSIIGTAFTFNSNGLLIIQDTTFYSCTTDSTTSCISVESQAVIQFTRICFLDFSGTENGGLIFNMDDENQESHNHSIDYLSCSNCCTTRYSIFRISASTYGSYFDLKNSNFSHCKSETSSNQWYGLIRNLNYYQNTYANTFSKNNANDECIIYQKGTSKSTDLGILHACIFFGNTRRYAKSAWGLTKLRAPL